MARMFGGRFFGGRFFGGRYFSGSGANVVAPSAIANPIPVFGWPIFSDRSASYTPTFSGGSWEAALPVSNVGNRRLSSYARSVDADTASTIVEGDLKRVCPIGLCALPKHGLSEGARVRWKFSNVEGDFSAPVYDSGSIAVWPSGASVDDLDGLTVSHVHVPSSSQSARYWQCAISNSTNPAGRINLPRVVVAGAWYPSTGMSIGAKIGLESATERVVTDGGGALYRIKPVRRYWDFTIPMLTETEAFAEAWKMQRQLGQHGQLFFVFDVNDAFMHERAFLGVLRELSAVEYPFAHYQSVPFRIVEEL